MNALAMMSPYAAAEKQAMLEAPDLKTRAEILVAVTEIELAKSKTPGETQTARRAAIRSVMPDASECPTPADRPTR